MLLSDFITGAWMMDPSAFRAFVRQSNRIVRMYIKAGGAAPNRYTDGISSSHDSGGDGYERKGRTAIIRAEGTLMRSVPWIYAFMGMNVCSTKMLANAFKNAAED